MSKAGASGSDPGEDVKEVQGESPALQGEEDVIAYRGSRKSDLKERTALAVIE